MIYIGNDWDRILEKEFKKDYYKYLWEFLTSEYKTQTIYPDINDIFNALKYTSYKDTKVVIVGQDPYINPGEAHGLAFSVQPGARIPPSLMNIFKELETDMNCFIPNNGCLIPWARQGVLLLNSVLTVRRCKSNSHAGKGWEILTDAILSELNLRSDNIIFLLWGRYAQRKGNLINNHPVLVAPHPSPLAGGGFFGCKHFSQASLYLYETTIHTIDWQIPNI